MSDCLVHHYQEISHKFVNMKLISITALSAFAILLFSCGSEQNNQPSLDDPNLNLDSLITAHPDSIPLLLKRGDKYFNDYNYDLALVDAAKAFRLDTNNIDARLLYAEVLNRRESRAPEEVASAQRIYKSVIKKQPKNLRALVGLAATYTYQRDFNSSFEYINKALRIDKHYRDGYVLKGTNYTLIGDREKAISSYKTAIQQDPEFYAAYLLLAQIYQDAGDPQCLEYYRSAAKIKPELEGQLRFYIAYCEQEYGDMEEAKRLYRVMASDTSESNVLMGLFHQGRIKQFEENQLDSAMYFYKSALQTEPRHVESWHNLGMCYDVSGNKTQALKSFSKALEYNPNFELSRQYADSIRLL